MRDGSAGLIGLRLLFVAMSATALIGCAPGPGPRDYFYRLDVPEPAQHLVPPPLNGTMLVARPRADALTGERHLLYRENGDASQVRRHAYHRWVESPTTLLQQQIAGYLRAAGIARMVVTPELRADADFLLTCRIVKLERVLDSPPHSAIELQLGLIRIADRRALMLKTYREAQPAAGNGVAASVDAYNQALSKILEHFVEDSSQLLESEALVQNRKDGDDLQ